MILVTPPFLIWTEYRVSDNIISRTIEFEIFTKFNSIKTDHCQNELILCIEKNSKTSNSVWWTLSQFRNIFSESDFVTIVQIRLFVQISKCKGNHVSCHSKYISTFISDSQQLTATFCWEIKTFSSISPRFLNNKYHFKLKIVSYDYFVGHKIVKMYQTRNLLHVVKILCLSQTCDSNTL